MGVIRGQTYEIYPYEVIKDITPDRGELIIVADPEVAVGSKLLISMLIGDGESRVAQLRGNIPVNTSQLEQNVIVLSDSLAGHISKPDAHNATATPMENRIVMFGTNKGIKSGAVPVADDDVVRKQELDGERNRAEAAEATLETTIAALAEQESSMPNDLSALEAALTAETTRAQQAEAGLNLEIHQETGRAKIAEEGLKSALTAEQNRAGQVEAALAQDIAAEQERAKAAEASLNTALDTAITAEQIRTDNAIVAAVRVEQNRAEQAEAYLGAVIAQEKARAEGSEQSLVNALTAEQNRAGQVEAALAQDIAAEQERAKAAEALKAPLDSPAFTGTPTTPTPDGMVLAQLVNVDFVKAVAEYLQQQLDTVTMTSFATLEGEYYHTLTGMYYIQNDEVLPRKINAVEEQIGETTFVSLDNNTYRTQNGAAYLQNDGIIESKITRKIRQLRRQIDAVDPISFVTIEGMHYTTKTGMSYIQNDEVLPQQLAKLKNRMDAVDPVSFVTEQGVFYKSLNGKQYIVQKE
jgi:hypothetical protein